MGQASGLFWNQILQPSTDYYYYYYYYYYYFSFFFPADVYIYDMEEVVQIKPRVTRRGRRPRGAGEHPNVRNTKTCFGFFRTEFYSSLFRDKIPTGSLLRDFLITKRGPQIIESPVTCAALWRHCVCMLKVGLLTVPYFLFKSSVPF